MASAPWTALILSGGASRRLGEDKAAATLNGRTLLERAVAALPAGVPVVVCGPEAPSTARPLTISVEPRPHGGPVAGLAAGLAHVRTPVVGVLAVDMPFAAGTVARLARELARMHDDLDACVPLDAQGRAQYLAAAYRTAPLADAIAASGDPHGRPMRSVIALLRVREAPARPGEDLADIDTADDLARARRSLRDVAAPAAPRRREDGLAMDDWIAAAAAALGIEADVDVSAILDVAREAAHGVERPAAPVSTYLMGIAVAGGMSAKDAADRLTAAAQAWT